MVSLYKENFSRTKRAKYELVKFNIYYTARPEAQKDLTIFATP